MARVLVDPGLSLQCDVDDFLWPWDTATPVLMLHGFARNADFWRRWIPFVAQEHRVYRPELRGFGRSDVPPEGFEFTLDLILGDLKKVLDHFEIERAHFVGESSGGIFSMLFAIEHPERVASLVLCDTPIRPPDSVRQIYALGEKTASDAMMKYGVGEWCRQTLGYRLDLNHASKELQDYVVNQMGKTPPRIAAALHRALRASGSPADLIKRVQAPALLLSGDASKLAGDQQAALLKEMPKARLHNFSGYGHGTNLILPEACTHEAVQFWSSLPS